MSVDKTLAVQMQIRQNAEEMSSALFDVSSWEKKMKEKDKSIKRGEPSKPRNRTREGGTVPLKLKSQPTGKDSRVHLPHLYILTSDIVYCSSLYWH